MTQDEIIRMAREAGLYKMIQVKHVVDKVYEIPSEKLERFATLVAAHEREACAKVCEEEAEEWSGRTEPHEAVVRCAAAIRARGE